MNFFILFYLFIIFFILYKVKKGEFRRDLLPVIAFDSKFLYNFIINFYNKHKRLVFYLEKVIILSLIFLIPFTFKFFFELTNKVFENVLLNKQEQIASLILPGVKAKGVFYIPFLEGILAIFIIALTHELFHGIIALKNNVRLKSAGFGFLFIFPLAYVDIDEESLKKIKLINAIAILAAGSFINVVTGLVSKELFVFLENNKYSIFNKIGNFSVEIIGTIPNTSAYFAKIPNHTIIYKVDNVTIRTIKDLFNVIKDKNKSREVILKTSNGVYRLNFTNVSGRMMLGIYVKENYKSNFKFLFDFYQFITRFLFYLAFLSINLGFINLMPLLITDGSKILNLVLDRFGRIGNILNSIINLFSLSLLLYLIFNAISRVI